MENDKQEWERGPKEEPGPGGWTFRSLPDAICELIGHYKGRNVMIAK